jgi:hypothetical protein
VSQILHIYIRFPWENNFSQKLDKRQGTGVCSEIRIPILFLFSHFLLMFFNNPLYLKQRCKPHCLWSTYETIPRYVHIQPFLLLFCWCKTFPMTRVSCIWSWGFARVNFPSKPQTFSQGYNSIFNLCWKILLLVKEVNKWEAVYDFVFFTVYKTVSSTSVQLKSDKTVYSCHLVVEPFLHITVCFN